VCVLYVWFLSHPFFELRAKVVNVSFFCVFQLFRLLNEAAYQYSPYESRYFCCSSAAKYGLHSTKQRLFLLTFLSKRKEKSTFLVLKRIAVVGPLVKKKPTQPDILSSLSHCRYSDDCVTMSKHPFLPLCVIYSLVFLFFFSFFKSNHSLWCSSQVSKYYWHNVR